jgi:hypothetical protein
VKFQMNIANDSNVFDHFLLKKNCVFLMQPCASIHFTFFFPMSTRLNASLDQQESLHGRSGGCDDVFFVGSKHHVPNLKNVAIVIGGIHFMM